METVSHRELRNRSGELLRRVADGEAFLVTNGGREVGVLLPVARQPDVVDLLVELGAVRPAARPGHWEELAPAPVPGVDTGTLLEELRGDRL